MKYKDFYSNNVLNEEFWGTRGAGCLFYAKNTNKFLLVLRSDQVNEPTTWGIVGGKIDDDDVDPKNAALREVEEEIGSNNIGKIAMVPLSIFKSGNFKYYNFMAIVNKEFIPELNWESDDYEWIDADFSDLPSPLHFGVKFILKHDRSKLQEIIDKIHSNSKK